MHQSSANSSPQICLCALEIRSYPFRSAAFKLREEVMAWAHLTTGSMPWRSAAKPLNLQLVRECSSGPWIERGEGKRWKCWLFLASGSPWLATEEPSSSLGRRDAGGDKGEIGSKMDGYHLIRVVPAGYEFVTDSIRYKYELNIDRNRYGNV